MSNNLLQQSNFFAQDFNQSLFFFYPKQFTLDLRLDGIQVINPVNVIGDFNSTNTTLDLIRTVNGQTEFNATSMSLEIIDVRLNNSFNFAPSSMSLETVNIRLSNADLNLTGTSISVVGLNKQIPIHFNSAPTANIIFIRESSLNISIAI